MGLRRSAGSSFTRTQPFLSATLALRCAAAPIAAITIRRLARPGPQRLAIATVAGVSSTKTSPVCLAIAICGGVRRRPAWWSNGRPRGAGEVWPLALWLARPCGHRPRVWCGSARPPSSTRWRWAWSAGFAPSSCGAGDRPRAWWCSVRLRAPYGCPRGCRRRRRRRRRWTSGWRHGGSWDQVRPVMPGQP